MKIEEQVVSFELAKKMVELGIKQDSLFLWEITKEQEDLCSASVVFSAKCCKDDDYLEYYPAYTVAELGDMLPAGYCSKKWPGKHKYMWRCCNFFLPNNMTYAETEADARAKMLIFLKVLNAV